MWVKRFQATIFLGLIFTVLVTIASVSNGEGLLAGLRSIPGTMFIAFLVVLWFTRNMDENSNEVANSPARQIDKLQSQLRFTVEAASRAASQGRHGDAAYYRSQAALLESELRSFGA